MCPQRKRLCRSPIPASDGPPRVIRGQLLEKPHGSHRARSRPCELYPLMFENAAGSLVSALAIMAYSPGAVAFHCAAGRDRTGVLAASLLLALGASDEDIVADYERTHANMARVSERTRVSLGAVMKKYGYDADVAARAATIDFGADRAMEVTLHTLRTRHGDPLAPLRAAGLGDGLVARLRERAGLA
ncbi:tyrosine-protein phosphatase [Cryobacterium sp. 1639]|nr:tyrosine-protein phosphatase [Cryobacterium sp. 1639]